MYQMDNDSMYHPFNGGSCDKCKCILEDYKPNEQQKFLCDDLNIPYSVWSLFSYIKMKNYTCFEFFVNEPFEEGISEIFGQPSDILKFLDIEDIIELSTLMYTFYTSLLKQSEFETLTEAEKLFLKYHKQFYKVQQRILCVHHTPLTLQDLCAYKIIPNDSYKYEKLSNFENILPNTIIKNVFEEYITPNMSDLWFVEYTPPKIKKFRFKFEFKFYPLNKYFTEMDRTFSSNFVVWFKHVYKAERFFDLKEPLVLVLYYFESNCNDSKWVCSKCFNLHLEQTKYGGFFRRTYQYFGSDLCFKDLQSYYWFWCNSCSQVPLFQLLKEEEYNRTVLSKMNSPALHKWYII